MTDRAAYIAGLRKIADLLEAHDSLPIPDSGQMVFHYLSVADPKAQLAEFARIMPGPLTKDVWGGSSGTDYFDLRGSVEGVGVWATSLRSQVCTRRVVGTREVVEEVPDVLGARWPTSGPAGAWSRVHHALAIGLCAGTAATTATLSAASAAIARARP